MQPPPNDDYDGLTDLGRAHRRLVLAVTEYSSRPNTPNEQGVIAALASYRDEWVSANGQKK